jgi:tight adherence protein C
MTAIVMALAPWMLGIGWGLVVAAPIVVLARRRALASRAAALRARPTRSGDRFRPWLRAIRRATGPVGRVVAGLMALRRARRADAVLASDLPVTIDVLSVGVAAGCTPYLAVESAARWAPASTATLLSEVLHSSGLGVGFGDALDELGSRTPRLRPLARALQVADHTGAPVAPALERLAAEQRSDLRRRAEERARKVPVRLLFPLVFLVLPAFGLLTVVPALLAGFGRS